MGNPIALSYLSWAHKNADRPGGKFNVNSLQLISMSKVIYSDNLPLLSKLSVHVVVQER